MFEKISLIIVIFVSLASCGKLYFNARNVLRCEDGTTKCSIDQTCCRNSQNDFGCCAFANATCCDNGLHCCPPGFHCSPEGCLKDKKFILPAKQSNDVQMLPKNVICPDKISYCNEGNTCCMLPTGAFGCCPLPDAVCCSDSVHCCPSGSTCDTGTATCQRQDGLMIEWREKKLAHKLEDTICPDKKSYCPSSSTCCLMPQGGYGCCPIHDAVCCDDHQHCCPSGYTCDTTQASCSRSSSSSPSQESPSYLPWLKKGPAKTLDSNKQMLCPNKTIFCDEGYTCCPIKNTHMEACCMFYRGVCCEDQLTCCPQGTVCSGADHEGAPRCLYAGEEADVAVESVAMMEIAKTKIVPCDNVVYCLDGQTCCPNSKSTKFMCCPWKAASCCGDGKTCCKSWCMPWLDTCIPNSYNNAVAWWDGDVSSSSDNPEAQKANWCDAGKSLYCPEGFKCHYDTRRCIMIKATESINNNKMEIPPRGALVVAPSFKSLVLPQLEASPLPHVCPKASSDQEQTLCGSEELCCAGGGVNAIKCCPFADGICCREGDTCCPSGTQCLLDGSCKSIIGDIFISQHKLTPHSNSKQLSLTAHGSLGDVHEVCPDKTMCPRDTTCCILLNDQYACCQFKMAMCCADKVHCCPKGYTCDIVDDMCRQSSSSTSWEMFTRRKAQKAVKSTQPTNYCTHPTNALAPTYRCPVDYSCCHDQQEATNLPVCCDQDSKCCDGFCCPNGYKCGAVKGRCVKEVHRANLIN